MSCPLELIKDLIGIKQLSVGCYMNDHFVQTLLEFDIINVRVYMIFNSEDVSRFAEELIMCSNRSVIVMRYVIGMFDNDDI